MKENTPHISLNIRVILCVVKEMFFFLSLLTCWGTDWISLSLYSVSKRLSGALHYNYS